MEDDEDIPFDEQPSRPSDEAETTKAASPWQLFGSAEAGNNDDKATMNFFDAVFPSNNDVQESATAPQPRHNRPSNEAVRTKDAPPRQSYAVEIGNDEPSEDNNFFQTVFPDLRFSQTMWVQQSLDETAGTKDLGKMKERSAQQRKSKKGADADRAAENGVMGDFSKPQETIEQSATADTLEHQSNDEESQDDIKTGNRPMCRGGCNKRLILVALILVIVVAATTGGVLASQDEPPTAAPTTSTAPSETPSQAPSQAPESVRTILQVILAPYAPLDEDIIFWLTTINTWRPDEDDPNYDYLWLERYTMVLLYKSNGGLDWKNNDNWMRTDYPTCGWYGAVGSNGCPGPVTDLVLPLNGLTGTLPSMILDLIELTKLHLARNSLTGTIPDAIWKLQKLKHLDLANNGFVGTIPIKFRRMPNLEYMYLSGNNFSGTLPFMIGDMSSLNALSLHNNQLIGTIPKSIVRLSNLKDLSLDENAFTGNIPANIGDLASLTRLSLNTNRLTGTIPASIANLINLQWLSLYENPLSGVVPKLPNNPGVNLNCFLGECFSDMYNAQVMECITLIHGC